MVALDGVWGDETVVGKVVLRVRSVVQIACFAMARARLYGQCALGPTWPVDMQGLSK